MKVHGNKGKKKSPEHRAKLLKSLIPFKKGFDSRRQDGSKTPTGAKSPMWRGGLSFQDYAVDWNETLRRSIRERDKYTCRICLLQQGDKSHDVHHIDYNKKNCTPENLITLCRRCHLRTNFNRDSWKKFFEGSLGGSPSK